MHKSICDCEHAYQVSALLLSWYHVHIIGADVSNDIECFSGFEDEYTGTHIVVQQTV